ncbi:MAG: adenosylhomocysteinase [Actinomycetota bacterium]|nr:adenosylhomocysteinase [Actinomycetota bacterium]
MLASSRIKDGSLAAAISDSEIAWLRHVTPITEHYCRQVARQDHRGKRLACWMHVRFNTIPWTLALAESGAEIVVGACNVDSTDDVAAAYLAERGITLFAWRGMSRAEYEENKHLVRAFDADYLCDMGGELSEAYLDREPAITGALEATTSGLNRLHDRKIPFPVFDWNSIPLKDRLENRFHVGNEVWPVFSHITSMSLYGRSVLVVGYGPVGKGIAERARALGASVHVADLDPVRLIEAQHHGCMPVDLEEGLIRCQIVVTATGVEGVLGENQLQQARPEAILFNAGHSNREIDIEWLYRQPHQDMRPHVERFDLDGREIFLLARGSLLNLAAEAGGGTGLDLFDLYTAVMLRGISWMFDGGAETALSGLQPYPAELEAEIARLWVQVRGDDALSEATDHL